MDEDDNDDIIHDGKHYTFDERCGIQLGIVKGNTYTKMGGFIHKDPSGVKKEIFKWRILVHVCDYPVPCAHYAICKIRIEFPYNCRIECEEFEPFCCKRRDKTPGACNGCKDASHCHYDKYRYDAKLAQKFSDELLVSARKGQRLTTTEIAQLGEIMLPLLHNGLSPDQILTSKKKVIDANISVRSFYRDMKDETFCKLSGITPLDLRQVVKRRPNSNQSTDTPTQTRKYIENRTYNDFRAYVLEHQDVLISEMDTVYNDDSGPFIQTFLIVKYHLIIGILHDSKTAADMVKGVDMLQNALGDKLFAKYFSVNLTDRGTEFSDVERLEHDADGVKRMSEFYCDPQAASQKSLIERTHELVRYILPKHENLTKLGLCTQGDMNLVISHVDSYPLPSLQGKSPLETVYKDDPELFKALTNFGIRLIDFNEIILDPKLLKHKK